MAFTIPTGLYLSVVGVSATLATHSEHGNLVCTESFNLVLRAARDTNIVLLGGPRLAEVDIHFTFSTKWQAPQALDGDLSEEDAGFLSHTAGERDEPFVGGGGLLRDTAAISSLLHPGVTGTVKLVLSNVPFGDNPAEPYVWGRNRQNMIRVSHAEVSVIRSDGAQKCG